MYPLDYVIIGFGFLQSDLLPLFCPRGNKTVAVFLGEKHIQDQVNPGHPFNFPAFVDERTVLVQNANMTIVEHYSGLPFTVSIASEETGFKRVQAFLVHCLCLLSVNLSLCMVESLVSEEPSWTSAQQP